MVLHLMVSIGCAAIFNGEGLVRIILKGLQFSRSVYRESLDKHVFNICQFFVLAHYFSTLVRSEDF
jgi:hypothetical protein